MAHTRTCERCGKWLDCDCAERETCECRAPGAAPAGAEGGDAVKIRCVCGEEHQVAFHLLGNPVLYCPDVPRDGMYLYATRTDIFDDLRRRLSGHARRLLLTLLAVLAVLALATAAAAECTIVSSYDAKGRLQQCVVCYDAAGHPIYIQCY